VRGFTLDELPWLRIIKDGRDLKWQGVAIGLSAPQRLNYQTMHKKPRLPEKPCQHCGLPFAWRKKWERVWAEVKYCSERCRHEHKRTRGAGGER